MALVAAVAAIVLLILTGCRKVERLVSGDQPADPTTTARSSPTDRAAGRASPTLRSGEVANGTAEAASAEKGPEGSPKPRFTAKLGKSCARRGIDTQTLMVDTVPGDTVAYSTTYSDGSSEFTSDYRAGYGFGQAPDGTFRSEWVVPLSAPTGIAAVRVVSAYAVSGDNSSVADVKFLVVKETETCP